MTKGRAWPQGLKPHLFSPPFGTADPSTYAQDKSRALTSPPRHPSLGYEAVASALNKLQEAQITESLQLLANLGT